jgi:hypothetical protein
VWWDTQVSSPVTIQSRIQKFGGILNRHGHFKHTASTTLPWLGPVNTALSYGSTSISGKNSLAFLLDLYFYFPTIRVINIKIYPLSIIRFMCYV